MSDSDNASEIPVCILSMFSRSSLLPHFFVLGVCVLVLNALQPKKTRTLEYFIILVLLTPIHWFIQLILLSVFSPYKQKKNFLKNMLKKLPYLKNYHFMSLFFFPRHCVEFYCVMIYGI